MFTGTQILAFFIILCLVVYSIISKICDTIYSIKTCNTNCIRVGSKEELEQILKQLDEIDKGEE